jgi:hypothetical protein
MELLILTLSLHIVNDSKTFCKLYFFIEPAHLIGHLIYAVDVPRLTLLLLKGHPTYRELAFLYLYKKF